MRHGLWLVVGLSFGCQGPEGPAGPAGPSGAVVRTIDASETWSADVAIDGVWYVTEGATITVDPAIQVAFGPGASLYVDGALVADGSDGSEIVFTNSHATDIGVGGVVLGDSSDESSLSFVEFDVPLRLEGAAAPGISDCAIRRATLLVVDRDASFTVTNCTFEDAAQWGAHGLVARNVSTLEVTDSTFSDVNFGIGYHAIETGALVVTGVTMDRVVRGLHVGALGGTHTVTISNVTVKNTTASGMSFYEGDVSVSGSSISNTRDQGIWAGHATSLTVADTTITDAYSHGLQAQGDLDADGVTVQRVSGVGIHGGYGTNEITGATVETTGGNSIYAPGDLDVVDSTLTGALSQGIRALGDITLSGTTISNTGSHGVWAYLASIDADDVTVSGSGNTALYADQGHIVAADVDITDSGGHGIYARHGDVTVTGSSVTGAIGHGVVASDGDVSATNTALSGIWSVGVYANRGDLTVDNVTLNSVDGSALQANQGNLTAKGCTASNVLGHGAYANRGNLDVSDSTFTTIDGNGVYAFEGDMALSGVSVSSTRIHGINVYQGALTASAIAVIDAGSHGVNASRAGAIDLDGVTITDPVGHGLNLHGDGARSTVVNAAVTGAGGAGLYTGRGIDLSSSSFSSGDHGVRIFSDEASTVDKVDVVDSATYGIESSNHVSQTMVTASNITGSGDWGVLRVQELKGSYVAGNKGAEANIFDQPADDGAPDGDFSTTTAQILEVDSVSNAQDAPVADTGPAS